MSVHVRLQRLQTLWPCLLHVQHQADEEVGKGRAARAGNDHWWLLQQLGTVATLEPREEAEMSGQNAEDVGREGIVFVRRTGAVQQGLLHFLVGAESGAGGQCE